MELADILAEESVIACSGNISKDDLLSLMCEKAAQMAGEDVAAVHEAIVSREQLGSTGLGNGIAIPHGKMIGLKGVTAVFARLDTPIEFGALDDQPVDLVMLLLAPVGAGAEHLKALARVARVLRTDSVTQQLRATDDTEALYALIVQPLATSQAA
ncbi:PTS sugar transporter subunit IIA [Devosia sp.]|uniref:PTS sugar transporter subunit IIA n=1 Tax=Devosia sp. TaxID=1871048 RepID=UPI003A8E179B